MPLYPRVWKEANNIQLTVVVLLLAMFLTRRKNYSIFTPYTILDKTRFAGHIHSRILAKFPFLVEMFYWGVSFGLYRCTKVLAQATYGGQDSLWLSAQQHGVAILETEAFLFNDRRATPQRWIEWRIQRWFLHGAEVEDLRGLILTLLNRFYALVHLPGTVAFLAYYYATAANHARFATVRRTMTLTNFMAFAIFILFPTMPPRLMPQYGFVDSVSLQDAESVWMGGEYVNLLAAMPSMHFGYAFCVGCTFVHESGMFRNRSERRQQSAVARACMFVFGLWYPSFMLAAIVSTANHYFLDAFAAVFVVGLAFLCNRVLCLFLPLEEALLWVLRLEKPVPITGSRKGKYVVNEC